MGLWLRISLILLRNSDTIVCTWPLKSSNDSIDKAAPAAELARAVVIDAAGIAARPPVAAIAVAGLLPMTLVKL